MSVSFGVVGRDYGFHWDEEFTLEELQHSVASGIYLPRYYNYPGVTFDLSALFVAPRLVKAMAKHGGDAAEASAEVLAKIKKDGFKQNLRIVYIVLTEAASIGVFCAVLALGGGLMQAALAGIILLSSWEVGYHARYIAPDGLLTAATAASLALVLLIFRYPRSTAWIRLAAAASGAAAACKYPGGIMLAGVALACLLRRGRVDARTLWEDGRELLLAAVIAAAVFLLLTPGAFVEPLKFLGDVHTEMQHYTAMGHGAHTEYGFLARLYTVLRYAAFDCFSDQPFVAAAFLALTVIGIILTIRTDPRRATVLVGIPLFLVLYFASLKVVFVRNYLVLYPFLAVLASAGLFGILDRLRDRRAQAALAVTIAALLAFNFDQQLTAALSIRGRHHIDYAADILRFVRSRPNDKIYIAPSAKSLAGNGAQLDGVGVASVDEADHVIYGTSEFDWFKTYHLESTANLANRPGTYHLVAGPQEVNWDYYPDWVGDPRIMEVRAKAYRQLKGS